MRAGVIPFGSDYSVLGDAASMQNRYTAPLRIVPGRNVWRVMISVETGWTRKQVRKQAAVLVARMLGNGSWWDWGAPGQTDIVIGSGNARPIQVFEAVKGGPSSAMGVPAGVVLGANTKVAPTTPEESAELRDSFDNWIEVPDGAWPVWWVEVEFWWRGAAKELDPWPVILDRNKKVVATVNVGVAPSVQGTMPDESRGESRQNRWEDWWNTTREDAEKTPLSIPIALIGAGSPKVWSRAAPWLVAGGLIAVAAALVYSRPTGKGRR